MFEKEPKFERWCWYEPLGVSSSRGDKLLVLESGIIEDRADESRRLLLMEKSDWALDGGEGEEDECSLKGKVSDLLEFRIMDRRKGLRDRGPDDSGWRSSMAGEFGGDNVIGWGRRIAVEVRREPCRFWSRKPMGTVVVEGPKSVRMESADDDLLGIRGHPVERSSFEGHFGESNSAAAEEGRGG